MRLRARTASAVGVLNSDRLVVFCLCVCVLLLLSVFGVSVGGALMAGCEEKPKKSLHVLGSPIFKMFVRFSFLT